MDVPPLRPGDRFDGMEIVSQVGAGAFARVYKVRAPGHEQPLALKLCRNRALPEDAQKRALREVAILRSLDNPHVCRLHGSKIDGDGYYILMDYLEGQQLDRAHDFDQPADPITAVGVIQQVCMGLAEAHDRGVVHRDLKPENIWIESDGTVKVLDFGFARAWDVPWAYGMNATVGRTVVGTPHYCQPEQLQTHKLTPASDVYSLTTILYELLTGKTVLFPDAPCSEVREALRDDPMGWLDAHAMRGAVPITRYPAGQGLPSELIAAIGAGLAKDPAHRAPTAGVLGTMLGDVLHGLGGAVAAQAEVQKRGITFRLPLLPGRRTLGCSGRCDLQLEDADVAPVHAVLEWSGPPRRAQLRPVDGAPIRAEGAALRRSTALSHGQSFEIGPFSIAVLYP